MLEALHARAVKGPAEFILLVPATPHGLAWAADMSAGNEEAEDAPRRRSEELRGVGLDVAAPRSATRTRWRRSGRVQLQRVRRGDRLDAAAEDLSKWLHLDLPRKAEAATGLPVTHVVGSEA